MFLIFEQLLSSDQVIIEEISLDLIGLPQQNLSPDGFILVPEIAIVLVLGEGEAKIPPSWHKRMDGPKIVLNLLHDILYLAVSPWVLVKHVIPVTFLHLTLQFRYVDLVLLNHLHVLLQGEHHRTREVFLLEVLLDFFGRVGSVVECSVYLGLLFCFFGADD